MKKPLSELLVKGIGKNDIAAIAAQAAKDEGLYKDLLEAISTGERTHTMKAAWIIGTAAEKQDLIFAQKYSSTLLEFVLHKENSGVVRELMKVLLAINLNEKEEGLYIDFCFKQLHRDFCFKQLHRSDVDIAVKYNSNKAIEKALKKYPELKEEFVSILESLLDNHTDAWKRYTTRLLAKLNKPKKQNT